MMVKAIIGTSPWLILLSMVILVATFIFFVWIAGRILPGGYSHVRKKGQLPGVVEMDVV
jgi:hypothetical protein